MKYIAKFYPERTKKKETEIAQAAKAKGLDGLTVSFINKGKAHFRTNNKPFSGFSLEKLKQELAKENLELGLVAPFFFDEEIWENYPEKRAKHKDKPWPKTSWYKPLCPLYPGLFNERLQELKEAVEVIKPDFVGLDFFRFPLFWEELDEQRELLSCECSKCEAKEKKTRKEIIQNYAQETKKTLGDIPVMVHLVPFVDKKTIEITGQDPKLLSKELDALSPMLYSDLLQRDSSFITSTLEELKEYNLWPSLEMKKMNKSELLPDIYEKILYFYWDV